MADRASLAACGPVAYNPADPSSPTRRTVERTLGDIAGVEGIGEGRDAIGNPAWIAYVRDHLVANRLPRELAGRPVVAAVSGEISAQPA